MAPDVFRDDFQGNKVYIGGKLDKRTFMTRMFPHFADRAGHGYPEDGLLPLRGVVPETELININFPHLNANGD